MPPCLDSILRTSAPHCASSRPAFGPATLVVKVTTRMPSRKPIKEDHRADRPAAERRKGTSVAGDFAPCTTPVRGDSPIAPGRSLVRACLSSDHTSCFELVYLL